MKKFQPVKLPVRLPFSDRRDMRKPATQSATQADAERKKEIRELEEMLGLRDRGKKTVPEIKINNPEEVER